MSVGHILVMNWHMLFLEQVTVTLLLPIWASSAVLKISNASPLSNILLLLMRLAGIVFQSLRCQIFSNSLLQMSSNSKEPLKKIGTLRLEVSVGQQLSTLTFYLKDFSQRFLVSKKFRVRCVGMFLILFLNCCSCLNMNSSLNAGFFCENGKRDLIQYLISKCHM